MEAVLPVHGATGLTSHGLATTNQDTGRTEKVTFSFGPNQTTHGILTIVDLKDDTNERDRDNQKKSESESSSFSSSSSTSEASSRFLIQEHPDSEEMVDYKPVPKGMTFAKFMEPKRYN